MVSNFAATPSPLYRHGSAPGAFPQPNCTLKTGKFSKFSNPFRVHGTSEIEDECRNRSMALETETPFPSSNPLASRALSAFELLFGAFIVIGHNVFHIVPNEVIVFFVLGWRRSGCEMADGLQWDSSGLCPGGALLSDRFDRGWRAHPPWTIRHRAGYWIFLATAVRASIGKVKLAEMQRSRFLL